VAGKGDGELKWVKGLLAAASTLLSIGTFVVTKWAAFLEPPPPLHYGEKDDFWFFLAATCAGVVPPLIWLFLPWKKVRAANLKLVLGVLTLVVLVGFVLVSVAYHVQRSKWTVTIHSPVDRGLVTVLIGDRLTDDAKEELKTPDVKLEDVIKDFGYHTDEIWTQEGLQRRQVRLGMIYLLASATSGVCVALAVWVVLKLPPK
jgi:hypothetical protein